MIPQFLLRFLLGLFLGGGLLLPNGAIGVDQTLMDQQVTLRIQQQLRSDIRLRDASLEIEVISGEVTLQGELPSFSERNRLERICRGIRGVEKVVNRITVAPIRETDRDLTRAVKQRLASDPFIGDSEIRVQTDGPVVTLEGTVASLHARRRAQWVSEQVRGVSHVRNDLQLETIAGPGEAVPDEQIAASIRAALGEDERSRLQMVEVTVVDGVVTLEGEVSSNARKRFYRYLVERMPGVREVRNYLEVRFADQQTAAARPSLRDAARDVQLALDAARFTAADLQAKLAEEKIAIVGSVASLANRQQVLRLAEVFSAGYPLVAAIEISADDRTAEQMRSELREVLQADALLAGASIDVDVHEQVATLKGAVERFADKLRAERLAGTVRGIASVDNRLDVDWMATVSDEGLKERIEQRLQRNRSTTDAVASLEVTVEQGRVTLGGHVASGERLRQVEMVVSGTDGVRSMESRVIVVRNEP